MVCVQLQETLCWNFVDDLMDVVLEGGMQASEALRKTMYTSIHGKVRLNCPQWNTCVFYDRC